MSKLLFVYNAKSDILNSAFDFAHKIIHPSSYECNLCKLTHGNFTEKKEWVEYKTNSPDELVFLHTDQFEKNYSRVQYPVVLKEAGDQLEIVLSTEELNEINSTEELIGALKNKM